MPVRPNRRAPPKERKLLRMVEVHPDYLVVDKKPGVLVHATPTSREPTALDALRDSFGWVKAVHRLDKEVSGLLVFARSEDAFEALQDQFRRHTAERRYLAAVSPALSRSEGTWESHLRMNRGTLRMYPVAPGQGRRAVTHWWKVRDLDGDSSLVEVALETGVKNQIRAQFAYAGHPLWGEQKYLRPGQTGANSIQKRRLFLHAALLGFSEPGTGEPVEFSSELPDDLRHWLQHPDRARPRRRPVRPRRRPVWPKPSG